MSYNTKQKEIISDALKKHKKEFTIKEIYNELDGKIGLTTIYRTVDKLVGDEVINKYIGVDNITYYQYLEKCDKDNHFFLKCEKCGGIIHVDCDCIEDLSNHISLIHHFLLKDNIIINGICSNCSKGVNKYE